MFLLDRLLRRFVLIGPLTIVDAGGRTHVYGVPAPGIAPVRLRFTSRALPYRMVRDISMGAGEGYMDGTMLIEEGDPRALADLVTRNAAEHTGGDTGRVMHGATKALAFLREHNPARRSQVNVAHHYDLSDALYDLFLDPERQYSCGYWRTPDVGLEAAQRDKMALIAAKLCLQPGMRVLDIGCGWGGMALPPRARARRGRDRDYTQPGTARLRPRPRRARGAERPRPLRTRRLPRADGGVRPDRQRRNV